MQLTFSGSMALDGFTLSAWKTHYAWYDEDSSFTSSNATLDAVWMDMGRKVIFLQVALLHY